MFGRRSVYPPHSWECGRGICSNVQVFFQGGTESKLHLPTAWRKFEVVGKRAGLGLCSFKTNSLNSSQLNKSYFDFVPWHNGRFSLQAPEGKCLQVPSVLLGRLGL